MVWIVPLPALRGTGTVGARVRIRVRSMSDDEAAAPRLALGASVE